MTEDDLVVALATALRDARIAGEDERVRELAATLAEVASRLAREADPGGSLSPAITHVNGEVDVGMVARLVLGGPGPRAEEP